LPAGYSSSEEEFLEPDEDDDTVSYARSHETLGPGKIGKLNGPTHATVQKPVSNMTVTSGFAWTRDSGAKRALALEHPGKVAENSSASDRESAQSRSRDQMNSMHSDCTVDCSNSFCRPAKKKVPASSCKNDGINWSWVDEVLRNAASKSVTPQGSEEVT
jgi:hypothetical protein